MLNDSKAVKVRARDRINLRLASETFDQIGAACYARPGSVSLNTWITEAIEEKLARLRLGASPTVQDRRAHG